MIKVFLVEDEKIIRKSIKNNVKWEENGFEFAGEAPDGEMALPMIEKLHPDIVITDIKMPFMDGLELSDILKKKMPKIQIIILSGYGEFDYAKEAIKIGVTDYLTKPVTGEQLLEALNKVKQKLDKKKRQEEDIKKLQKNIKTQMKNMRYQFFGNLIRGKISVSKLMEQGNELGIDLMAPAYNFMLFKIFSKNENDTEAVYDLRTKEDAIVEEVSSQFENMIVFHRVTEGYVLMIKAQNTEETIQVAKDYVAALTKRMKKEKELQWFAGIGHAVERLHNLSESYDSASKAFAYQYQSSGNEAVFFDKLDNEKIEGAEDLQQVDFTKVNSESLEEFLKKVPQMKIISLTATPPYDSTPAQWKRYIDMCGPIDEEIFTPELVKEGSLCPHQDYVYFNWPTKEETLAAETYLRKTSQVMEEIKEGLKAKN